MLDDPYRIEVGRMKDGEFTRTGSGTFITPRHVLTAGHVLKEGHEVRVRVDGNKDGVGVGCQVKLAPGVLDIAVLDLGQDLCSKPASLSDRLVGANESYEIAGFPRVFEGNINPGYRKVGGTARSLSKATDLLMLSTYHPPEVWNGFSGAGVWVAGYVVGVLQSVPTGHENRCIDAIPVARFLMEPWYNKALGLDVTVRVGIEEDLVMLKAHLVALLATSPLTAALRGQLHMADASVLEVVDRLVHIPAEDAVFAITGARNKLRQDERGRRDAREVFLAFMPYATDWQAVLEEGRTRHAKGLLRFEVPCHRQSVAEFVMAGIHRRPASFLPLSPEKELQGWGCVYMPSPASAPFCLNPSLLRDAVMQKLAAEFGEGHEKLNDLILGHFKDRSRPQAEKAATVKAHLRIAEKRRGTSEYAPPYLVVVDAAFGGAEGGAIAWQMVCDGVGTSLPALHLVRLRGGGDDAVSRDTVIFDAAREILAESGGINVQR
jgi:hypothetical protein